MAEKRVSIGQARQDISELVNRVAYGGEHILLTSRGKPKAALVSIDDYERLKQTGLENRLSHWEAWLAESEKLAADVLARRGGQPLDLNTWWQATRAGLEERDARTTGS